MNITIQDLTDCLMMIDHDDLYYAAHGSDWYTYVDAYRDILDHALRVRYGTVSVTITLAVSYPYAQACVRVYESVAAPDHDIVMDLVRREIVRRSRRSCAPLSPRPAPGPGLLFCPRHVYVHMTG